MNHSIQGDTVIAQPQRKRNAIQGAQRGEGAPRLEAKIVGDRTHGTQYIVAC